MFKYPICKCTISLVLLCRFPVLQELLLGLCSKVTPGDVQGTICDTVDQTRIVNLQGKVLSISWTLDLGLYTLDTDFWYGPVLILFAPYLAVLHRVHSCLCSEFTTPVYVPRSHSWWCQAFGLGSFACMASILTPVLSLCLLICFFKIWGAKSRRGEITCQRPASVHTTILVLRV